MKKTLYALALMCAMGAMTAVQAQPVDDIGKTLKASNPAKAVQMAEVTQRGAYVFASFGLEQPQPAFLLTPMDSGCFGGKGKDGGGKKCLTVKGPGDEDGDGGKTELAAKAKKKRSKTA